MASSIENPFELVNKKLDLILKEIQELKADTTPKRIPFPEFCRRAGVSRPTAYEWIRKKLVQSEMVGGRRYIINDGSLVAPAKYLRV